MSRFRRTGRAAALLGVGLLVQPALAGVVISTNDPQPGINVPITWTVTTTDTTQIASIHIKGGKPPPGIVGVPQQPDGWKFIGNAAPADGSNATFDWEATANAAAPAGGWQFTITFDKFVGSASSDEVSFDVLNPNGTRTFTPIPKPGSPSRGSYAFVPVPEPSIALGGLLLLACRRRRDKTTTPEQQRRNPI
jgi:hypothetical protein